MIPNENKKVPKLRFPEFAGEWEEKKIKEVAPLQRGFDLPTSQVVEGEFPVVYSNGILRKHNEYKAKAPGVVTGRSGTIGKITYVEENYWPHNTSLWVTNFYNNYPKYIFYMYSTVGLNYLDGGSTVPTLNRNDVHSKNICIPTFPEQQKIADFLTSVDKKIEQLNKKKELLEQYKKGCMQKIFSQEMRFKPTPKSPERGLENPSFEAPSQGVGGSFPDWEEKKLGDVGTPYNGLAGKSSEDFGSGKPYIQYKQIFDNSRVIIENFGYVKLSSGERQNKVLFGDVFFTTSSETPQEVAFASVLLDNVEELYLNSFCFGFRPKSLKNLNPLFSQYLFRNPLFRKETVKLAQGSTRYNLSKTELMKIIVKLPHPDEQKKIADFLTSIDKKIELVDKELELAKSFKKGLLQLMFV